MQRAAALTLVLMTAYVVQGAGGDPAQARSTALALGVALIAAGLAGEIFERLHLPRLTGYLLFGLVCGPYVANIISRPMARELQIFNGLAIALIAFIAGLELNLTRLWPRLPALLRVGGTTLAFAYMTLGVLLWTVWPWLPIAPEAAGPQRLALTAVLTTLVVSFSPTVTIAVIAESQARGPLSELVLAVVILADLVLILCFTLALQFARLTTGGGLPAEVGLLARLAWDILGSFAFGALLGSIFALYVRYVGRELTLVLVALCVVLSEVGARLHFEPLLAALAAGIVVENVAAIGGDAVKVAMERGALPVLIIFFAAAGASLHLDALARIGLIAAAISLVRIGVVRLGASLSTRFAPGDEERVRVMWMGLISQAGVTLGLTMIIAAEFPTWGAEVQTLMVALIALHELIGPVLFRSALARAGEIGRLGEARAAGQH